MTRLVAQPCGCLTEYFSGKRPEKCACGNRLRTPAELNPPERKPMRRVSLKRQEEIDSGERRKTGSTLKPGRGLAASPEQQRKVRDLACIVCGRDRHEITITAMHVYPRRFVSCDCAEGVVAGCIECHPRYEEKGIDLLGLLVAHDFRRELVHAVVEHHAPIFHLLEIVTGTPWVPSAQLELATARIVEPESGIAA